MSAQAYQAMLDTVDTELKAPMDTLGSATQPADVHAFGTSLSGAIQEATVGLRSITPPAAVARANEELAGALDSLGTQAEDLSTTDSGARICAGSAGLARLTQSTAAQNVRDAVHSLATADSSQAYTFGAFLPAPIPDRNRRLANGQLIKKAPGGKSQFVIKNQAARDVVVTLASVNTSDATFVVYLRSGADTTVKGVPDGTYALYVSGGVDWDGDLRLFTTDCGAGEMDHPYAVTSTASQYTKWTVTLGVQGGGIPQSGVDPGSIPT